MQHIHQKVLLNQYPLLLSSFLLFSLSLLLHSTSLSLSLSYSLFIWLVPLSLNRDLCQILHCTANPLVFHGAKHKYLKLFLEGFSFIRVVAWGDGGRGWGADTRSRWRSKSTFNESTEVRTIHLVIWSTSTQLIPFFFYSYYVSALFRAAKTSKLACIIVFSLVWSLRALIIIVFLPFSLSSFHFDSLLFTLRCFWVKREKGTAPPQPFPLNMLVVPSFSRSSTGERHKMKWFRTKEEKYNRKSSYRIEKFM